MAQGSDVVLIIGSGPNAPECASWPRACFDRIVAINNAWRVRADWDDLIFPEDFPEDRRPKRRSNGQSLVEADRFVPAQNAYGGFVYAGGTMAFTAAYWALHALRPRVLAFIGCDMVYPSSGPTHFYGTGAADPLRPDPTLQDLGAKSARLGLLAACQGCSCVNLSRARSELLFPRGVPDRLRNLPPCETAPGKVGEILDYEERLGYFVPSGRYWENQEVLDPKELTQIDAAWRTAWTRARTMERAA